MNEANKAFDKNMKAFIYKKTNQMRSFEMEYFLSIFDNGTGKLMAPSKHKLKNDFPRIHIIIHHTRKISHYLVVRVNKGKLPTFSFKKIIQK